MTRFDKELRKLGFRLEQDFECLPCDDIDCVGTYPEVAQYRMYHYGLGLIKFQINRDLTYDTIYED